MIFLFPGILQYYLSEKNITMIVAAGTTKPVMWRCKKNKLKNQQEMILEGNSPEI